MQNLPALLAASFSAPNRPSPTTKRRILQRHHTPSRNIGIVAHRLPSGSTRHAAPNLQTIPGLCCKLLHRTRVPVATPPVVVRLRAHNGSGFLRNNSEPQGYYLLPSDRSKHSCQPKQGSTLPRPKIVQTRRVTASSWVEAGGSAAVPTKWDNVGNYLEFNI